jgi:hypothetical protein
MTINNQSAAINTLRAFKAEAEAVLAMLEVGLMPPVLGRRVSLVA